MTAPTVLRGLALIAASLTPTLVLSGCANIDASAGVARTSTANPTAALVEDYLYDLARTCRDRTEPQVPNSDPCLELAEFDGSLMVAVLFDHYVENLSYPATAEAAMRGIEAARGAEFHDGNTLAGYEVQPDEINKERYQFCVIHDSGAWALYESNQTGPVARGVTGGACEYAA